MMVIVLLTLLVVGVLMAAMAVGVLMGREPIKGSCGGVGAALKEKNYVCPLCGDDPNKCENESQKNSAEAGNLAYDASTKK